MVALGLRCYACAFSSCGGGGSSGCEAWASHCGGFFSLPSSGSVVVAPRLSCFEAWDLGIGIKPVPLHLTDEF